MEIGLARAAARWVSGSAGPEGVVAPFRQRFGRERSSGRIRSALQRVVLGTIVHPPRREFECDGDGAAGAVDRR